jgi:2,3-bisphosphoglycerate-dependent phosphoglycerate mutase
VGVSVARADREMVRRVLAWIRHGEYAQPPGVPSAHLPYGLTARGREQARAAAHRVWQFAKERGIELDPSIDTSSLRRAWETAHWLSEELARLGSPLASLAQFDALAERGLGAAANLTVDEIEAVLASDPRFEVPARGWKRDPAYVLPLSGAESLEQAGRRVARHVLMRMGAARGLKLFVGHGGAFRQAAVELGLLAPTAVADLSMTHGDPIYLEYQADHVTTTFSHVAGQWRRRSEAAPLD